MLSTNNSFPFYVNLLYFINFDEPQTLETKLCTVCNQQQNQTLQQIQQQTKLFSSFQQNLCGRWVSWGAKNILFPSIADKPFEFRSHQLLISTAALCADTQLKGALISQLWRNTERSKRRSKVFQKMFVWSLCDVMEMT